MGVVGCSFERQDGIGDGPVLPPDAPALRRCSAADPHLRVCFSFDQAPLAPTQANEGAAPSVTAQLVNATATAGRDFGAVHLDATSRIFVPERRDVTGIVSLEAWFRFDAAPPDGERTGILDTEDRPEMSLFRHRIHGLHVVRCAIGDQEVYAAATRGGRGRHASPARPQIVARSDDGWRSRRTVPGAWAYVACVCANGSLRVYGDGTLLTDAPGSCSSGAIGRGGMAIGQHNHGDDGVDDWLVGAIDTLRLWDVPLSPSDVCASAGRTDC
ncbi:MAG: hypothetical protein KF773_09790 [Deltaproteobacteria bacterium]|nr:hypothetical protein [Deltaproteobacteria bacterium]